VEGPVFAYKLAFGGIYEGMGFMKAHLGYEGILRFTHKHTRNLGPKGVGVNCGYI
jgi:hypothetical protein